MCVYSYHAMSKDGNVKQHNIVSGLTAKKKQKKKTDPLLHFFESYKNTIYTLLLVGFFLMLPVV